MVIAQWSKGFKTVYLFFLNQEINGSLRKFGICLFSRIYHVKEKKKSPMKFNLMESSQRKTFYSIS